MPSADRLALLLLATGTMIGAPATALAAHDGVTGASAADRGHATQVPAPAPATTTATAPATADDASDPAGDPGTDTAAGDTSVDDGTADDGADDATPEDDATDPFCDTSALDVSPDDPAADGADDPAADGSSDPADDPATDDATAGDSADDDTIDLCDDATPTAAATSKAKRRSVRVPRSALRGAGHLDVGTVSVPAAGTVTETLTPAGGTTAATRAVRAARTVTLATGHRSVSRAETVRVPLHLTKLGRKRLAGGKAVRVTLTTTIRLRSGHQRTRSQAVTLRHAAK